MTTDIVIIGIKDIMQLYDVTRRRLDNAKKKLDDALGTDGAE